MKTTVVNVTQDKFDVYIGRGCYGYKTSKWYNPFNINSRSSRADVIKRYEDYIRKKPELMNALSELRGKILGCWCKPKDCHGDILVKLLKELDDEPPRPLDSVPRQDGEAEAFRRCDGSVVSSWSLARQGGCSQEP